MQKTVGSKVQRNRKGKAEEAAATGIATLSCKEEPQDTTPTANSERDGKRTVVVDKFLADFAIESRRVTELDHRYLDHRYKEVTRFDVCMELYLRGDERPRGAWVQLHNEPRDGYGNHEQAISVREHVLEKLKSGQPLDIYVVLAYLPKEKWQDTEDVVRPFPNTDWLIVRFNSGDFTASKTKHGLLFTRKPESQALALQPNAIAATGGELMRANRDIALTDERRAKACERLLPSAGTPRPAIRRKYRR